MVEELLRTGLTLVDLLGTLLEELPDGAFPGEDDAAVLLEMVIGSCRPAAESAGGEDCRRATALIGAMRDSVVDDLRAAAALAADASPTA